MIRLVTLATAGDAYLNFMGNEFGHPEWIDFPRAGNGWSYHYARRQWHLRDDPNLVYHFLADFDQAMIDLARLQKLLDHSALLLRVEHCDNMILGFERAGLLFLFNFHPTRSYTDYGVEATPGKYRLVLNTDSNCFGGHGLVTDNQEYFTQSESTVPAARHWIKVYLPSRTALVLHRISE